MQERGPFQALFRSGEIGRLRLRNRIVMPPMGTNYGDEKGRVTDRLKAYYEARAKGGAGLVIVEIISVDSPRGNCLVGNLTLHDDSCIPGMAELTAAVKSHGTPIAAQLFHSGVETHRNVTGVQPVGPSVVKPFGGDIPRALTVPEIKDLIEKFAQAALRARAAGFDAVEIHGATYYLIAQFLSRRWNKRDDRYGGDLWNRTRFLLETLNAVRAAVGAEFPVWCRINGSEFGFEEGLNLEEARQIAKWAQDGGAQAIHVSSFGGGTRPDMGPTVLEHGVLLPLAREIKKVLSVPVIAAGRIDPAQAQKALTEGDVNFISIGRGLIADPELPNKLREGRPEDIAPCIGCLECIHHIMYKRLPLRCSVNALCGREGEYGIKPASKAKDVVVIGGGPGGMEAARVAALRGHRVTLYEKESVLGGLSLSAGLPPGKEDINRLITYLKTQMAKLGIRICLGERINPSDASGLNCDAIVVACGASPVIPDITGLEDTPYITAEESLLGRVDLGDRLLIVGGSLAGLETADHFSDRGKNVTVVEILDRMASDMNPIHRRLLLDRLRGKGVSLMTGISDERIEGKSFLFKDREGKRQELTFQTLIIAAGRKPGQAAWEDLRSGMKDLWFVGDAVQCRGIIEAIADGNRSGRSV